MNAMTAVQALDTLEACQAYVDDAACFPAQFKPGLVKQHQRDYTAALEFFTRLVQRQAAQSELALIGWGEIENGRLVSFAHQRSEQCTTEIFAPGAAVRTGGAA